MTPMPKLQGRVAAIRRSMQFTVPTPPVVSEELVCPERGAAGVAVAAFEPSNREILIAISALAGNMVVKEDIRIEVEAIGPDKPLEPALDAGLDLPVFAIDDIRHFHEEGK